MSMALHSASLIKSEAWGNSEMVHWFVKYPGKMKRTRNEEYINFIYCNRGMKNFNSSFKNVKKE